MAKRPKTTPGTSELLRECKDKVPYEKVPAPNTTQQSTIAANDAKNALHAGLARLGEDSIDN